MNKIDYQALREKAERATQGKWWIDSHGQAMVAFPDDGGVLGIFAVASNTPLVRHEDTGNLSRWRNDNDATYIAAACPATMLALLDELERNQQYIKRRDQENEDIALTVGRLRVELEAEKQRAKDLFMENARLKSGIAGLIHLGIRYADVEVMKIAGDAQLSTPCTDSIINSIATGIRIKGE